MVDAVRRHDPAFVERVDVVGARRRATSSSAAFPRRAAGADAFAAALRPAASNGKVAQLVDWSPNAEEVIADAVRAVFGADGDDLSDRRRARSPAQPGPQSATGSTRIQVAYHSPLMRTLQHASYTFRKRLSHTADSQDQRHRMVPGSRPLMTFCGHACVPTT